MAIYSMHVSNVSRAAGSSSIASCSYITSQRMRDERTGEISYGYGRRERVEHVATILPKGAPAEYSSPERLFNAIEAAERRSDARPAKKIMVALPRELDEAERVRVVEAFIRHNLTGFGYAATYAIHTDKAGSNPHAHILVANRPIDLATGKWAAKSRSEFALDANGERIPVIDPETGVQKIGARNRKVWKRVTVSSNPLDSKEFLEQLREDWAKRCNLLLVPKGVAPIDHRSLEAQGVRRVPTIHEGYAAREIEKRGGRSVLAAINRAIADANRRIAKLVEQARQTGRELAAAISDAKKDAQQAARKARDGFMASIVRTGNPDRLMRETVKAPEKAPETKPAPKPRAAESPEQAPKPKAEPWRRYRHQARFELEDKWERRGRSLGADRAKAWDALQDAKRDFRVWDALPDKVTKDKRWKKLSNIEQGLSWATVGIKTSLKEAQAKRLRGQLTDLVHANVPEMADWERQEGNGYNDLGHVSEEARNKLMAKDPEVLKAQAAYGHLGEECELHEAQPVNDAQVETLARRMSLENAPLRPEFDEEAPEYGNHRKPGETFAEWVFRREREHPAPKPPPMEPRKPRIRR